MTGSWASIVGHQRNVAALSRAVDEDRPHHAYLFLGPEGAGKMTLARVLAAGLICLADAGRPCGECGSCRKLESGAMLDVWTEEPTGNSHTIGVDQVREVQRRLGYQKSGGRYRVVMIDGAGTMNVHAQNKLLKTLEEPPEGTILVLCALHPGQLLQTVRSRCQKLHFGPVETEALASWLVLDHGQQPGPAAQAAAAARGLPGRALGLLDSEVCEAREDRHRSILACLGGDPEAVSELVSDLDRDKEGTRATLTLLQELLRDAMLRGVGGSLAGIHPMPDPDPFGRLDSRQLAGWIGRIEDVRERLGRNVHPGALVDDLIYRLYRELR